MIIKIVKIKDVCTQINGVTYGKDDVSDTLKLNYNPILRASNISNDGTNNYDNLIYVRSKLISETKFIKAGDILIAASTGSKKVIGKATQFQNDFEGGFGAFCKVLRPNESIDNQYLGFFFQRPEYRHYISVVVNGANINNIRASHLNDIEIPLPPLETQKQIAQVLATADQLRKDCQQVEQELNALAQSVFLEMFGDPVTNPKGWEKVPVSYFVNEFQGGKSVASAGDEKSESTYRVLKISAVTWKDFNPLESKPLPNDHKPNANHFVKQNDLLFSRANTKELVGATSYVFETPNNILLPDKLWRFVWKQETKVAPLFIWYLFLNEGIRYQLGKLATGSGGSMKNISKSKLMPFKVIFPSYEQQKQFSAKIKHIRELQKINLAEKGRYEILFNSLLQKAFKSELNLKATS